jgi:hypothetical protein
MAEPVYGPNQDPIEVMPVVVLFQVFPARPSSIPDIRDFVRRCLAESPLTEEGNREVGETVFRALLDAAGPSGSIQVAFRIFPEHVEVDVLHSELSAGPPGTENRPTDGTVTAVGANGSINGPVNGTGNGAGTPVLNGTAQITAPGASFVHLGVDGQPANFADWMSVALRREGLTQEAAARLLGVSVKTSAAGLAARPSRDFVICGVSRKYSARFRFSDHRCDRVRKNIFPLAVHFSGLPNNRHNCLIGHWTCPHMCPTVLPWRLMAGAINWAPNPVGSRCVHTAAGWRLKPVMIWSSMSPVGTPKLIRPRAISPPTPRPSLIAVITRPPSTSPSTSPRWPSGRAAAA